MKMEQPLWGRGIMVSPQHFQQQAAYAAWSAECIARLGLSHPWGVIDATFEPDVLKLCRLQARHLHIRFPDGTLIDTDNADDLPPVLSLESESHEVVVVLALPLLRANGGNCLKPDEVAERPVRYRQRWRDVRNAFGDDTRQIAVMQPELTLRFSHQNSSDYLTCPIARLQQNSQGSWTLDETYLPPLLTLRSSRWLVIQLEQLMMQLRARLSRLMDMRRESNERMADFAVADVSLFWLLNALNSAEPVLGQFQLHPQSPPERLYSELARLAGSLLTFSLEHQVSAIPVWQHEQLNKVFPPLFDLLPGLNSGLAILEALICSHWDILWPRPVNARMEILRGLSQRLQQLIRGLSLHRRDLSQLYYAEQLLRRLERRGQQLELKLPNALDALRTIIHNSAVRLEKGEEASALAAVPPATAPEGMKTSAEKVAASAVAEQGEPDSEVNSVAGAEPEPPSDLESKLALSTSTWKAFAAGAVSMLAIGMAAMWGWQILQQPDPVKSQLAASLAPPPSLLTPEQRARLREQSYPAEGVIRETRQQLKRLWQLPPDWNLDYSRQLIEQAQALWPEQALAGEWQQQLNANALPAENLTGWHQGMVTLQQLGDRLSRLDKQKGKYITVSELKTEVFDTMQAFYRAVPAEEQLRMLSLTPAGQPLPAATTTQIETHLKQLIARYALLKQASMRDAAVESRGEVTSL